MTFNNKEMNCSLDRLIQSSLVPDKLRPHFWQQQFGQIAQWMTLETLTFSWMSRLCKQYNGGIWCFYILSNGGAYIAPDSEQSWSVYNKLNGNSAEMSSEAVGIAVCLMNWSHHACRTGSSAMSEHFYRLREFALSHPESIAIMRIID